MINMLQIPASSIVLKQWTAGLSSYTQSNCSCTLTDKGYRIYRPPNKNPTNDGRTMWGGFVLKPFNINSNFLQKGHTYVLKFHISGQSSNSAEFYWTNQVGWGGGGLEPSPSNVLFSSIPSNFNGEYDFIYRWTINDNVTKICTSSYSGFVAGTEYISYRDFKWGFNYTNTGALGTDVYITDLRMYDITNIDDTEIKKTGILETGSLEEITGNFRIAKDYETMSNYFYEI